MKKRNCPKSGNLQMCSVSPSHTCAHIHTLCPWLKVIPGSWSLALIRVRALERVPNDPESSSSGHWCSLICAERSCHWDGNWMWPLIKHSKRDKNRTESRKPITLGQKVGEIEGAWRQQWRVNPCIVLDPISDDAKTCGETRLWAHQSPDVGWTGMRGMSMRVSPPPHHYQTQQPGSPLDPTNQRT